MTIPAGDSITTQHMVPHMAPVRAQEDTDVTPKAVDVVPTEEEDCASLRETVCASLEH